MAHQQAYLAAVDGKHRGSKSSAFGGAFRAVRGLLIAAAALIAVGLPAVPGHAESGPFAPLAGNWSGNGTITLDDGSKERIRCHATYQVSGSTMTMTLTCASDAYKFQLSANVVDEGGAISGSWSEATRNVSGTLQGRGGGGNFEVVTSAAGFNANITLRTSGNKQSINMRTDSTFRVVAVSLSR
jgi:hypothetical protein